MMAFLLPEQMVEALVQEVVRSTNTPMRFADRKKHISELEAADRSVATPSADARWRCLPTSAASRAGSEGDRAQRSVPLKGERYAGGKPKVGRASQFDVFNNTTGAVAVRNIDAAAVIASYCTPHGGGGDGRCR